LAIALFSHTRSNSPHHVCSKRAKAQILARVRRAPLSSNTCSSATASRAAAARQQGSPRRPSAHSRATRHDSFSINAPETRLDRRHMVAAVLLPPRPCRGWHPVRQHCAPDQIRGCTESARNLGFWLQSPAMSASGPLTRGPLSSGQHSYRTKGNCVRSPL